MNGAPHVSTLRYVDDVQDLFEHGIAYLFDATSGKLIHTIQHPTENARNFGNSVSIYGQAILVGTIWDQTNGVETGAAYLFDASTSELVNTILNPSRTNDDVFLVILFLYIMIKF